MTFIVFFLLFLLPFLIAPFGITQFENPKVILAEAGIILLLFYSLIKNKGFLFQPRQFLFFGAIILLTSIDLLFFRTSISFFGNEFRMQGIFLVWLLIIFAVVSSRVQLTKVPWWLSFGLIVVEFIATGALPYNESQRAVGSMGEPNATAAFMLFLWPFLWFTLPKNRWWHGVVLSIAALCLIGVFVLTGSRSAVIGFLLQVLFLVLLQLKVSLKKTVVICFGLLLFTFSLPFLEQNVLYENRGEVWTAGYYAGLSRPILGGGFGNTELQLHQAAQEHHLRIRYYYVDSAHNIFLDWWVQGGIVALLIFCVILFTAFRSTIERGDKRNSMLFVGIIAALSFNPASVVSLLALWWLIGQELRTK